MKSILVIMPEFFKYELEFQKRLTKLGHRVYYIPDRPSRNPFFKILARKARVLLTPYLQKWYNEKFAAIPADVNEILIIKGECILPSVFKAMRARFPKARVQVYLWDSIRNSPGAGFLIQHADKAYSFDFQDSEAHPELTFRPNFFTATENELKPVANKTPNWDLTFVGTVHSDRLQVLHKIASQVSGKVRFYKFLFFQSVLLYAVRRFFDPAFKHFKKDLSLTPMSGTDLESVMLTSGTILDIHHPGQTGITQRSIKGLAMGQRLITTNATIKNYPFFDERYVRIIDRRKPVIDEAFLQASPPPPHPAALELELTPWLQKWGF